MSFQDLFQHVPEIAVSTPALQSSVSLALAYSTSSG